MTDLAIGRLSATIHAVPGIDDQRSRVDRMLGSLARHRLDDCVARLGLPEGEWCLRRVDVVVGFDADDHEATIESAWADAVVASFRRRLDTSSSEVVHYRRRQDALDDLVTAVASGRTERAWAWRQMGILAAIDPSPVTEPAGAMLAAIARWPDGPNTRSMPLLSPRARPASACSTGCWGLTGGSAWPRRWGLRRASRCRR